MNSVGSNPAIRVSSKIKMAEAICFSNYEIGLLSQRRTEEIQEAVGDL